MTEKKLIFGDICDFRYMIECGSRSKNETKPYIPATIKFGTVPTCNKKKASKMIENTWEDQTKTNCRIITITNIGNVDSCSVK